MSSEDTPIRRNELIDEIAQASVWGYLGLFVGTGFSKCATNGAAPSFEELIKSLIARLNINVDIETAPVCRLKSLPQIASELVRLVEANDETPERAGQLLREEVAHICNITPAPPFDAALTAALKRLVPSWVMTTNYDLVLEMLLEEAISVLPDQPLVARPDRLPIYHLHGHRLDSASIKITEEDYVGLLGPIDYQRLKLPLILFESTTVMLGYALGDINVRAAMAWSRSFRENGLRLSTGQGLVVQALYEPSAPCFDPYHGPNGEIILEIAEIPAFLEELADRRETLDASLRVVRDEIANFLATPKNASAVATPGPERDAFLLILEEALPVSQATRIIEFLSRAIDPIWVRAREYGGFRYYDVYLKLLIDVLSRIEPSRCNPGLLTYLAEALDRVGWYVDARQTYGTAWAATNTWLANHSVLGDGLKKELRSYAVSCRRHGLTKLLDLAEGSKAA